MNDANPDVVNPAALELAAKKAEANERRTKALLALDALVQKGIKSDIDQVNITSALCVLACQRFLMNNAIFDRGRRMKFLKWVIENFTVRLRRNAVPARRFTPEELAQAVKGSLTIPAGADEKPVSEEPQTG